MVRNFLEGDMAAMYELWNSRGVQLGYAPVSRDQFQALLTAHGFFSARHAFVWEEGGEVLGFAIGCTDEAIPRGKEWGYISCVILAEAADTRENFCALLSAMEDSFREAGKSSSVVSFFNPMRLPWIVPGTAGHQHNNLPGVPVELPQFARMREFGYRELSREIAMYLSLEKFRFPERMEIKQAEMAQEGYTVSHYDAGRHSGLKQMLAALGNPVWCDVIPQAAERGMKLLVGLQGNKVAGFAGPIYPERSGRGYFDGIGVAPEFQGHGLGKLLFYRLLQEECACGAKYMSLFTGKDNPARFLYQEAGFRVCREFAVMCKELD